MGKEVAKTLLKMKFLNREEFIKARSCIRSYLKQVLPEEYRLIEVAVNEAINNAYFHSNVCNIIVDIKIWLCGCRLIIRVKHNGPGFPARQFLEGLTEHGEQSMDAMLEFENGRGLMIMKAAADRLYYNREGTEVLMVKKVAGS